MWWDVCVTSWPVTSWPCDDMTAWRDDRDELTGSRSIPSYMLTHAAIWPQQIYGPKIGGLCPFGEGELGPHLAQCGQGRGLPACQVSSWSVPPFGHNTPSQTGQTDRHRTDSIGQTVLQTVGQKRYQRPSTHRQLRISTTYQTVTVHKHRRPPNGLTMQHLPPTYLMQTRQAYVPGR